MHSIAQLAGFKKSNWQFRIYFCRYNYLWQSSWQFPILPDEPENFGWTHKIVAGIGLTIVRWIHDRPVLRQDAVMKQFLQIPSIAIIVITKIIKTVCMWWNLLIQVTNIKKELTNYLTQLRLQCRLTNTTASQHKCILSMHDVRYLIRGLCIYLFI